MEGVCVCVCIICLCVHNVSSVSLVEIDDCSDDDITDVTSAIFGDFTVDYVETGDYATSASPALKSLQKQVGQ